ncbi:MAG: rhomboid family intramembrane serine protease [Paludibacteraceae bacterium]|jgi:membrane associated rhomboid family serine protease|nr:rhomboid family intramembrane serine protease [Paludibacteraceae bacterium]MBR5469719.1 rhomboid family intramembrane serine protease [Paludibacteraceae bacterium]
MNIFQSFKENSTPIVNNLIIINLLVWLGTLAFPQYASFLSMHYWASDNFNLVQLVTYMFMHGSFSHLFFNMFAVYMFGVVIERVWGSKKFLLFYLVTGIGAAIIQQLVWTWEYQPVLSVLNSGNINALTSIEPVLRKWFRFGNIEHLTSKHMIDMANSIANAPQTVGASGAVFGILLAFGWLFPEVKMMLLFFPVPIKARIFVMLYAIAELFLGVANFSADNVAHFAHLGGMIFGAILILYWKKKGKLYN